MVWKGCEGCICRSSEDLRVDSRVLKAGKARSWSLCSSSVSLTGTAGEVS